MIRLRQVPFHNSVIYRIYDISILLLCMYVSEIVVGNPIFGAAIRLTLYTWAMFARFRVLNPHYKPEFKIRLLFYIILILILSVNIVLIHLSPGIAEQEKTLWLLFFVLLTSVHVFSTDLISYGMGEKERNLFAFIMVHTGFYAAIALLTALIVFDKVELIAIMVFYGLLTVSLIIVQQQPETPAADIDLGPLQAIHSYSVFSKMSYFSYTAFFTSLMMYICYMAYMPKIRSISVYLVIALWIGFVYIAALAFYRLIIKIGMALRLGVFFAGAASWIFSSVMLYRVKTTLSVTLWSIFWAFGLAAMYGVLSRLNHDMKLVAELDDRIPETTRSQISLGNRIISYIAFSIAGILMLIILTFWNFFIVLQNDLWIKWFRTTLILFPLIFISIAMVFALRQPLDDQNRLRLMQLGEGDCTKLQKARLHYLLVRKYSKRFGIKILVAIIRPFWRHKVYGKENINSKEFPSVFVCNHSLIYGPITAILHMPTYFRPWINSRLLEPEQAFKNMYAQTFSRFTFLPVRVQKGLASMISKPLCWALNSYEPIPVYRDSGKQVVNTMKETIQAMMENDNILLFPENPRLNENGLYSTEGVGEFFTGFAHIAKMYYDKTNKCALFYPIYANKKKRTFTIGKPIQYNSENHPKEERIRLASELKAAMSALSENPKNT